MAKLRVFKSIENNNYVVIFVNDPNSLSSSDVEAMQKFGEPEINMGGTFLATTANEFVLPSKFARIRADFPQRVEFDSTSDGFRTNTVIKVTAYATEIASRFQKAFVNPTPAMGESLGLRDLNDAFTGEQITNV